jgi:hypothetical protein
MSASESDNDVDTRQLAEDANLHARLGYRPGELGESSYSSDISRASQIAENPDLGQAVIDAWKRDLWQSPEYLGVTQEPFPGAARFPPTLEDGEAINRIGEGYGLIRIIDESDIDFRNRIIELINRSHTPLFLRP